jgi:hypothetical protein
MRNAIPGNPFRWRLAFRRLSFSRLGILLASLAILLGPFYSEPDYAWFSHTVSELAAQNTRNAWVMQAGLFVLGAGILVDYLRSRQPRDIPFAIFGLFIALSAIFPHKPFIDGRSFSGDIDFVHSIFASFAGVAAVVGFILRFVNEERRGVKVIYLTLSVAYTILPGMMVVYPSLAGAFQRMIFFSFFIWAWFDFPADPKS